MGRAEDLFERLTRDGEAAIVEMIAQRQVEDLFLDFKRSHDSGVGTKLHQFDLENFGRAVSGFGNSDGGVIVWGVACKRDPTGADVPSAKVPIEEPQRFVGWLNDVVTGCT